MNPQEEKQETAQTVVHNPFPEPQTIPAGWDTSELLTAPPAVSDPLERDSTDQ